MTSHRLTKEQMLERFAAMDAAEQAERAARDSVLQSALDSVCELQIAWALDTAAFAPRDAVVVAWAAEQLGVELTPGEPIPAGVQAAFTRSQEALWAGEPVPDALALLGDKEPDQAPLVLLVDVPADLGDLSSPLV